MPRTTDIIATRVKRSIAVRVRAAAAATGRSTAQFVADLLTAAVGCRD